MTVSAEIRSLLLTLVGVLLLLSSEQPVCAETGYDAWLRYAPLDESARKYDQFPNSIASLDDSAVSKSARDELIRGVQGMLGKKLQIAPKIGDSDAIVLGNAGSVRKALAKSGSDTTFVAPNDDGFMIKTFDVLGKRIFAIIGGSDRGTLYGAFEVLRRIATGMPIDGVDIREEPAAPIRILNHWDNLDGTIERGYAGKSIFWENGHVVQDLKRVRDYARLMASVGINGCSINNVNADARVVTSALPARGCANCGCIPAVGRANVYLTELRKPARRRWSKDI